MFVYNVELAKIFAQERKNPFLCDETCLHYYFGNQNSKFTLNTHHPKLDSTCISVHLPVSGAAAAPDALCSSFMEVEDFSIIGVLQYLKAQKEHCTLSFSDANGLAKSNTSHWRDVYFISSIQSSTTKDTYGEASKDFVRLVHSVLWFRATATGQEK